MTHEEAIQHLQDWSQAFTGKNQHPPAICFLTFGCQMNFNDAELIAGLMNQVGFRKIDHVEEADFIVINTCAVRESAENRVYGQLGRLKILKESKPELLIAIGGCMVQQPQVAEKIQKSYRQVDLVFGTHTIDQFAELLWQTMQQRKMVCDITEDNLIPTEGLPRLRSQNLICSVSITYGCNNFCSYCIVPYVRGRERSRESQHIIDEIKQLVADGCKEVTLLGQNVNSYGKGLQPAVDFADLLARVDGIEGLQRIRFMTSHPRDITEKLVDTIADSRRVCHQLHLPMQSGSSPILRAMNRGYSKEYYLGLVQLVRVKIPDIVFSTDIIVGFPGETEADFENTLDIVRQVRFDSAYTFIYSQRSGTPAAAMPDQIPYAIKQQRIMRLMEIQADISNQINQQQLGQIVEVLVEGPSKHDASMFTGRTRGNKLVHFAAEPNQIGQLLSVKIEAASSFHISGTVAGKA
ncbi:MAG TPA: tRNA (N6-isopentenyl adenosine(37)-C2)-methylthiotransferase MiaB [Bacillota bacterium]|nr:tRNA (N6-isopentenyl adenosine(37)-C2)-methylthiotransferase MiaB [Bacillota bacterium]